MSEREDGLDHRGVTRRDLLAKTAVLGAGAAAAGALAPVSGAHTARRVAVRPRRGGKITWGLDMDPTTMAPFGVLTTQSWTGKQFAYDSLLEWDRKLNVRPALAEKYEVSSNRRQILWTLRRGVKFHNGKELTAVDVAYSIRMMLNPPPPGMAASITQLPQIAGADVVSKYVVRLRLKQPDATVPGFFAMGRLSPIVPQGLYNAIDVNREAIGTGPFRLVGFSPGDRTEYVANRSFWKKELPYLASMTLKTLSDEQARIAALRAGAIDGANFSTDAARALSKDKGLTVLKGKTAAWNDLLVTIKDGPPKPWADARVRVAIMHAIDRDDLTRRLYAGDGNYTSVVPPGFGPWPLPDQELRKKWQRFDLAAAKKLMADAGFAKGFSVKMKFPQFGNIESLAVLVASYLKAINIDVDVVASEPGTFVADFGTGNFDWAVSPRSMRGDVDGFMAEFHPASPTFKVLYPKWRNIPVWRAIGNGRITFEQAKRVKIYHAGQRALLADPVQIPLNVGLKYIVVRDRVRNMYVDFAQYQSGLREVWVNQ